MITPEQLRMFKGAIDKNVKDMADESGVSFNSLGQYLKGQSAPGEDNYKKLARYIDLQGYELVEGGVLPKKHKIDTYQGRKEFGEFFDDVYETVKEQGGQILITNVDEDLYDFWMGEKRTEHPKRMNQLNNFTRKILICEGDTNFAVSDAAEYRWQPRQYFNRNSWYKYGNKLALVEFTDEDVIVTVIQSKRAANSFISIFNQQWDSALIPPNQGKAS